MNVVGPGITIEDYDTGRAKPIDVFEGQIREWILAFARHLAHEHAQREHAGIAFNAYDRVVVDLTTHDAGGISQKDVDLAKVLEEIASKLV